MVICGCWVGSNHLLPHKLSLRIWPVQNPEGDQFPELFESSVPNPKEDPNLVGLAVSGGGSRSVTLFVGYMRALHHLHMAEKISYLSSVSGGSWASSVYTFADLEEAELLGMSVSPKECTRDFLRETSPGQLGEVVTRFNGFVEAFKELLLGVSTDKLWQKAIGHDILAPFGLDSRLMALNKEEVEAILKMNKGNRIVEKNKKRFVCPKEGRPFLIMNATLMGPKGFSSGWGTSVQFTPLYSGKTVTSNLLKSIMRPQQALILLSS